MKVRNLVYCLWIGVRLQTESLNKLQRKRTCEIFELFKHAGYRSCVLKGQGSSLYYPRPDDRQSGDIDIWVEGDRDTIIQFLKSKGYRIGHIDIKHADVEVFEDVPVEVHFQPSWMYSPSMNNRLNRFFNEYSSSQFLNYDGEVGFAHTTVEFDLVFFNSSHLSPYFLGGNRFKTIDGLFFYSDAFKFGTTY